MSTSSAPSPDTDESAHHRWSRGFLLRIAGWGAITVVVLALVWLAVTGLLARHQLEQVRGELPQLRTALTNGNFQQADDLARQIRRHAGRAHSLTSGPAWWVSANVPAVGTPLRTTREISTAADELGSSAVPGVVQVARIMENSRLRSGSTINLEVLSSALPVLDRASTSARAADHRIAATSASSWLSPVDDARTTILDQLGAVADQLTGADRTVQTALPMLGDKAPQRYFVGIENEAESRGLGGLPGGYAIVVADHGKITFTHFGSDSDFDGVRAGVDLGSEYDARYSSAAPTTTFVNSTISPNFPDAAKIWAGMWQHKTGQRIDGAIAIDPGALSELLAVTGSAHLPDGTTVSSGNVVALIEKDQYARFHANAQRKAFITSLARTTAQQLADSGDPVGLVHAGAQAAAERRIVLWTAAAGTERNLLAADYGGALPSTAEGADRPFTAFTITNAAGTKLDYYLGRAMTYRRGSCAAGTATASFTLTNDAPASGLPAYVTTRSDSGGAGQPAGSNRLLVTYYGSAGAHLVSAAVNGRPVTLAQGTENGLLAVTTSVELPVHGRVTVTVTLAEPAAHGPVQVLRQPGVHPITTAVTSPACS